MTPPNKAKVSMFNTFGRRRRDGQAAAQEAAPTPLLPFKSRRQHWRPAHAPLRYPRPQWPALRSPCSNPVWSKECLALYSDGSIEAQLPQGTLRFGSISALRSHIENSA